MYCSKINHPQNLRAKNNNSLFLMTLSWQGSAEELPSPLPGVEGPFIKFAFSPSAGLTEFTGAGWVFLSSNFTFTYITATIIRTTTAMTTTFNSLLPAPTTCLLYPHTGSPTITHHTITASTSTPSPSPRHHPHHPCLPLHPLSITPTITPTINASPLHPPLHHPTITASTSQPPLTPHNHLNRRHYLCLHLPLPPYFCWFR